MFQRDYILRIIEQFIRIISEIIFKRKQDLDQDVIDQVYSASTNLFGLDFHMLDMIKTDALISFLDSSGDEPYKLYAYGLLFKEISYAQFKKGYKKKAIASCQKAIGLIELYLNKTDDYDRIELETHLEDLADWAIAFEISDRYLLKLFSICSKLHLYHKAENILFELDYLNNNDIIQIGIRFFELLETESDEILAKCGLSKSEIELAYQDFKKRIN